MVKTLTILAELEPGQEINFFIDQGMGYFRRSAKKNQDKLFFEISSGTLTIWLFEPLGILKTKFRRS